MPMSDEEKMALWLPPVGLLVAIVRMGTGREGWQGIVRAAMFGVVMWALLAGAAWLVWATIQADPYA